MGKRKKQKFLSGIGAIGCLKIDLVPQEIAQELETKYLQDGRIITLRDNSEQLDKPWIILLHRQENTFGYLLHTPINLNLLQK